MDRKKSAAKLDHLLSNLKEKAEKEEELKFREEVNRQKKLLSFSAQRTKSKGGVSSNGGGSPKASDFGNFVQGDYSDASDDDDGRKSVDSLFGELPRTKSKASSTNVLIRTANSPNGGSSASPTRRLYTSTTVNVPQ